MTRFRPIPRRSALPDFHDLLTDDLGNGEPSHVAGARAGMAVRRDEDETDEEGDSE